MTMKLAACTLAQPVNDSANCRNPVPRRSCIFLTEKPGALREVFASAIVDILLAWPDTQVYYFIRRELHKNDPLLTELRAVNRFHAYPIYAAYAVLEALSRRSHRDASTPCTYIFVEDPHAQDDRMLSLLAQTVPPGFSPDTCVCLSVMTQSGTPVPGALRPLLSRPTVLVKQPDQHQITSRSDSPCVLTSSSDLPVRMQKLLQEEEKRQHKVRRNNRPTPTQIILAVTALLLSFIAARLGG